MSAHDEAAGHDRVAAVLGDATHPDTVRIYSSRDIKAAYDQGRREGASDSAAYTQGWADGCASATAAAQAHTAQHLSMDVIEAAWEQAEIGDQREGDKLITRFEDRRGPEYCIWTAPTDQGGGASTLTRILQRAPRPLSDAEKIEALLEQLDDEVSLGRQAEWLADRGVRVVSGDE